MGVPVIATVPVVGSLTLATLAVAVLVRNSEKDESSVFFAMARTCLPTWACVRVNVVWVAPEMSDQVEPSNDCHW